MTMITTTNGKIETGTRVMTHGNIENLPAYGTITSVYVNKFGAFASVVFDSPRFDGDTQEESYPTYSFGKGRISTL